MCCMLQQYRCWLSNTQIANAYILNEWLLGHCGSNSLLTTKDIRKYHGLPSPSFLCFLFGICSLPFLFPLEEQFFSMVRFDNAHKEMRNSVPTIAVPHFVLMHLGKLHWSQGLSKLNSSIKIQVFQIYTSWYIRWGSKQTRQNPSVWKEEKLPHKVLFAEYYFPSLPKMRTIYKHVCSSWNISTVKYETAVSYT